MKIHIIIILIFLFSFVGMASARPLSNSGNGYWIYSKEINIQETAGETLSDYQIMVGLDSSNFDFSQAKSDGADIRFALNGEELPYWIENLDNSNNKARIWVKIPTISANSNLKLIMYFGNPSATAVSNGDSTNIIVTKHASTEPIVTIASDIQVKWLSTSSGLEFQSADLVIGDISFLDLSRKPLNRDPVAGEPIYILVGIKNNGDAPTYIDTIIFAAFAAYKAPLNGYKINEIGKAGQTLKMLKPGETSNFETLWNATPAISEHILVCVTEIPYHIIEKSQKIVVQRNIQKCHFDISRDAYSFENYPYSDVDDKNRKGVQDSITNKNVLSFIFSEISFVIDNDIFYAASSWSGHCYGMASTSILYYTGDLSKPFGSDGKSTFGLSKEDPGVMKYIGYYQRLELLKIISDIKGAFSNLPSLDKTFSSIEDALDKDRPVILSMWKRNSIESHAVVVMDYYERADNPYLKNIVIYDNNYPGIATVVEFDKKLNKISYYDYDRVLVEEPISLALTRNEITKPSRNSQAGQITTITWPTKGTYDHSEPVPVKVDFTNKGSQPHSFWVGYSVQDSTGKWWDEPAQQATVTQPGGSGSLELQWKAPEDAPAGAYTAIVALWEGYNTDTGLLEGGFDRKTKENAFQLNPVLMRSDQITDVIWPAKDTYDRSEPIPVKVDFNSIGSEPHSFWVGYSVQDSSGKWWDAPVRQAIVTQPGESGSVELQWQPPEVAPAGAYTATVALWEGQNSDTGLMEGEFDRRAKENAFQLNPKNEVSGRWNRTIGEYINYASYEANSIQQTNDGGYIIAGEKFSTSPTSIWLIKVDDKGNRLWDKTFSGSFEADGFSTQQTTDGGYIIAGRIYNSQRWPPIEGHADIWLVKTDADGNMLWNKTFNNSNHHWGGFVQQTTDGGYIITSGTDSHHTGNFDVWLIKTDADGNMLWNKTFGGLDIDWGYSVRQTSEGGYIIAADTCSYGAGNGDVWLIKTDANGNELWNKTFGSRGNDHAYSVLQTFEGGYIVAGLQGRKSGLVWLIKTDINGNKLWDRTFGGSNEEKGNVAYSIQQTKDGGYVISGETDIVGKDDAWLIKTDAVGNMLWDKTFGGSDSEPDRAHSVLQTSDGGYVLAVSGKYVWLIKTDAKGNEKSPA